MSDKPKHCPYCGSTDLERRNWPYGMECIPCGAIAGRYDESSEWEWTSGRVRASVQAAVADAERSTHDDH